MAIRCLARSVRGLEWIVADEVSAALPARKIRMAAREIRFETAALDERLLGLRTVDDVFLVLGHTRDLGPTKDVPARLAKQLATLPWAHGAAALGELRPVPRRAAFDVVASFGGRRNFNRYALEDAVGHALARQLGRYVSRTPGADGRPPRVEPGELTVRLFLDGETVTAALRIAARPLHRRAYKQDTGPGTLHPPLAAALARLGGGEDGRRVLDTFCGDGTIAVESAARGADMLACDLAADRLRNAAANAARAGAAARIAFLRADAAHVPLRPATVDVLLTNPPWDLSVSAAGSLAGSLRPFWARLTGLLTAEGRICAVTDVALDGPGALRAAGCAVSLAVRVRLQGRLSHVVLAAPGGVAEARLPSGPARWHARAREAGVVDESGF